MLGIWLINFLSIQIYSFTVKILQKIKNALDRFRSYVVVINLM